MSHQVSLSSEARRSLCWGLLGFAAIQLSLAIGIELWLPQLRDPLYGDKLHQLRRRIAAGGPEKPLAIMLGSSRTIHAFDAAQWEELAESRRRPMVAYNFGVPGAGPLTQLVCLRRLLADGVRPDLLLVEVFPPMLTGTTPAFDFGQFPPERLWRPELGLIERYAQALGVPASLAPAWYSAWCAPAFSHRFALQRMLWPRLLPTEGCGHLLAQFDPGGWNRLEPAAVPRERRVSGLKQAKREYLGLLTNYELGGPACAALEELLGICHHEQIATVLVVMPEGPTFQSWYRPGAWPQVADYINRLSRRFAMPVVDAHDWMSDEQFVDSHHLLAPAAEEFSKRLAGLAAEGAPRTASGGTPAPRR
ncbi:MAG TPA: DUF1574 family protein [Pirellulales bacterium]|nr:DUF1574 family protein [Pirellulales bacterium]